MELSILAIIILLVIILFKQGERFAKLDLEMNAIKKRLDLLLEKQQDASLVNEINAKQEEIMLEENTESASPVEEFVSEAIEEIEPEDESIDAYETIATKEIPLREEEAAFAKKEKRNINYEKFIGENLFGKIGILVLVIGVGFFVKYAIDKEWINETMRTILGFVIGSVLLFIAEKVRTKYRTFSSLLAGGAFAVFYLTVAISYHYYHLFSQTTAFLILVFLTLFMSVLAVLYDRRELAVIALIGGFIAPFLVSRGEGNYIVLFTYLTILNIGMFGLSLYKKWAQLPLISFAFTYLIFFAYVLDRVFNYGHATDTPIQAKYLFLFASAFYFIFLLPVLSILKNEGKKLNKWLLSIVVSNNFIYLFLGSLFLNTMLLPIKATGLFTLFIALVNLVLVIWLRKNDQNYKFLVYTMLGLVLTFVSITIPIQLEGNYITLFWASEMVLLLWLYIKSGIRVYEKASLILVVLTLISYFMDIKYQWVSVHESDTIFINSMFATGLYSGLAIGAFALLIAKYRGMFEGKHLLKYTPWNALMLIVSVSILYYTFMFEFYNYLSSDIAYKVMHLFTSCCILALCYGFRKRFPIKDHSLFYLLGIGVNVLLYMIFVWSDNENPVGWGPVLLPWLSIGAVTANLVYVGKLYYSRFPQSTVGFTVYLCVLSTLFWIGIVRLFLNQWGLPDEYNAGFSIAMAIAGFVQMSLGMRLHQKELRIVSLVTLGIVLVKLVLIDLWAMPTIGKIVVFIILGIILLALSFLYQKLKDVLFKNNDEQNN